MATLRPCFLSLRDLCDANDADDAVCEISHLKSWVISISASLASSASFPSWGGKKLHSPCLRGAVGFIADTSWREHRIEVFHDFPGQLVGQNALDIGCRKQFGSCALPVSDAINVVSHLPNIFRNCLCRNFLGAFFLIQYRPIIS